MDGFDIPRAILAGYDWGGSQPNRSAMSPGPRMLADRYRAVTVSAGASWPDESGDDPPAQQPAYAGGLAVEQQRRQCNVEGFARYPRALARMRLIGAVGGTPTDSWVR